VNTHCATEEAAVTGLQFRINRVLDDDRRLDRRWLRCVPLALGVIKPTGEQGFKPPLPSGLFPSFA